MSIKDELTNPWSKNLLSGVQENFDKHDANCVSLYWFWFAHKNGVSCPSDLDNCFECDATFYIEGLVHPNYNNEDYGWDEGLCACCAEKQGFEVTYNRYYGVSLKEDV